MSFSVRDLLEDIAVLLDEDLDMAEAIKWRVYTSANNTEA